MELNDHPPKIQKESPDSPQRRIPEPRHLCKGHRRSGRHQRAAWRPHRDVADGSQPALRDHQPMKTIQVTKRIGENMGPVDWSYNFLYHFQSHCCSGEKKKEYCKHAVETLRHVEEEFRAGKAIQVRVGEVWLKLLDVGMYDGWPFWVPTPSFQVHTIFGTEWHTFSELKAMRFI